MSNRNVYEILKQVQNDIRIGYIILCHPEFISGSHNFSNKNFNLPSYRTNEVRCGIFEDVIKMP